MFKKKYISVFSDIKSGFFCKLCIILGLIFIIFYIFQKTILFLNIDKNIPEIILAFSIILFGLGFFLFFLSRQFNKLAQIAKEIENDNFLEDKDNST